MNAIISGKMEKQVGSMVFKELVVWNIANDTSPYETLHTWSPEYYTKYVLRIGLQQNTGVAYTYLSIGSCSVGSDFEFSGMNNSVYESFRFSRLLARNEEDVYWLKQHVAGTPSSGLLKSLTFGILE